MLKNNLRFIFAFHFLFVVIIQVENAFMFYQVPWWKLILAQFQNISISLVLCALYYTLRKNKFSIYAYFFFSTLFFIFIFLNQIFFQIFHENFAFTFADGFKLSDFSNYWGSFAGELKAFHLINLAFLLAGFSFSVKRKWITDEKIEIKKELVIATIFLVLTFPVQYFTIHSEVNNHLAFSLFRGIRITPAKKVSLKRIDPLELYKLKFGQEAPADKETMRKNAEVLRNKKNVIFIILESVGSMQIFENNKIQSEDFPHLSKDSDKIYSFSSIQNNFPGTTRSHIPIITGGKTITWGSVFKELLFTYKGPTLASEFKKQNKRTALISAMGLDFENLSSFYNNLGFDYVYDSDREPSDFKKKNSIHSWGIDEKVALKRFDQWYELDPTKPFYLHLLTNTTHHPYGAPDDFQVASDNESSFDKYKRSLRYTDHIIGLLVKSLKEKNILEETVIYISGDHGEAFGRFHENNFAHKSSVYEETIKNFLMIYSPSGDITPGLSHRRGSLADIMPTILGKNEEMRRKGLIGQDLNSPDFGEKLAFFHKNTHPEVWGVRDGRFKYFEEKVGGSKGMLFDLEADPTEQKNILASHKDKVPLYRELIANWFVQTNDSFVMELEDYEYLGDAGLSLTDVNSFGPKRIAVGIKPKGLNFTPLKKIHPEESLTLWAHGVSYPKDTTLRYEFTSPSGVKNGFKFTQKSDWSTVYVNDRPKSPREEGVWKASIYDLDGNEIISTLYKVSLEEKLHWSSVQTNPGLRQITFGIKKKNQDFQELQKIHPNEHMSVFTLGIPYSKDKNFIYEWVSPSGKIRKFNFKIKAGWHSTWVYHDQKSPMETGIWALNIKEDSKIVISSSFKVDRNAPLHIPIKF